MLSRRRKEHQTPFLSLNTITSPREGFVDFWDWKWRKKFLRKLPLFFSKGDFFRLNLRDCYLKCIQILLIFSVKFKRLLFKMTFLKQSLKMPDWQKRRYLPIKKRRIFHLEKKWSLCHKLWFSNPYIFAPQCRTS